MSTIRQQAWRFALCSSFACRAFAGDEPREVELKAPMLVCHKLADGERTPAKDGAQAGHDLVFFVLAGRDANGSEIRQLAPKGGGHLKVDTQRKGMLVKNVPLWRGSIREGETVTLALSVREQDGGDSADGDLKEAAAVAPRIDNAKGLAELARVPIHEILQGERGENDHIGTILVRLKNAKGRVTLDTEPGADAAYLKGHSSLDPLRRAFKLKGSRSDYELHLSL